MRDLVHVDTYVTGDGVKPVPEKFRTAADVKKLNLAVAMLPPAKGKPEVKTLVVTYRMGDVLPPSTKQLEDQWAEIAIAVPNGDGTSSYGWYITSVQEPKEVLRMTGPMDGSSCGYARTNFKTEPRTTTT